MFILLILVGNILVLIVFCFCKELRIIINYFLILLFVVDFFMVLFLMLIFMVLRILEGNWFFGGDVFYDIWWFMDIVCGIVFIWNFCFVSLDRYFVVILLFKYLVIFMIGCVKVVIVLVWVIFLVFLIFLYFIWMYKSILIIVISFFLLLVIIIFSYVRIIKLL